MTVIEEPSVQQGRVAHEIKLTPSTIKGLMEKMEDSKLVVRVTEGKVTNVYPTAKAKELYPKMKNCRDEFYTNCISFLGAEESNRMA